ncbi:anti-sigma factor family protein [Luteitalea sp.]
MTSLNACTAVQEQLSAFRDGELSVADHLDVGQHLNHCAACRRVLDELDDLGVVIRREATLMAAAVGDEPVRHGLASAVVSRVRAEEQQSWPVRVREAFDDMHLVWAGLCATAAVVVCVGLAAGIVLLAPADQPSDSLRALIAMMASPGTDLEPLPLAPGMEAPRVSAEAVLPLMLASDLTLATDQDVELAISAVVTREGRIERTQQLEGTPNRQLVQSLEDAARFHPASRAGSPVAVSLIWLVSHTTVRPTIIKPQSARQLPADLST